MPDKEEKKNQDSEETAPDQEASERSAPPEPQEKTSDELAEEYLNDLRRCQAEFENYKKRQAANQKELGSYLIEKLVLDIIPVLDNFRSATMHVPEAEKDSPWVMGIQYIEKQLETVLTDNGMRTIEAQEGEAFDPKIHEAVSYENDGESDNEKHVITKVIQKGYRLGDKVIRAARVIVR